MFTLSNQTRNTAALFIALVALGASSRFLGLAPNFAAVSGVALFAGYVFRSRLLAAAVPFAAMLLSDMILGGYHTLVMASVYLCLLLPAVAGPLLGARPSLARVGLASLGFSVLFFLVTNFAVWGTGGLGYSRTLAGLIDCYAAGIPFFRYTLAGDLAFAMGLFGLHHLASRPASASSPVAA
jgi:hypothetical protein